MRKFYVLVNVWTAKDGSSGRHCAFASNDFTFLESRHKDELRREGETPNDLVSTSDWQFYEVVLESEMPDDLSLMDDIIKNFRSEHLYVLLQDWNINCKNEKYNGKDFTTALHLSYDFKWLEYKMAEHKRANYPHASNGDGVAPASHFNKNEYEIHQIADYLFNTESETV